MGVNFFNGEALFSVIHHSFILSAPSGKGDIHGGDNLVALRSFGFRQGILFIGRETCPDDLSIAVGGAGDYCAATASEGKGSTLQRSAARSGFYNLKSGSVRSVRTAPLEWGLSFQSGITGIGYNIGLLRGGRVIGQEQVILRYASNSFYSEAALFSYVVYRDTDLEGAVVLFSIGIQTSIVGLAGIHLIAGGPMLLYRFQRRIILSHENGASRGVGRIDLRFAVVNPCRGGRGNIHHTGIIFLPVNGFFPDAVFIVVGSPLQTEFVEDLYAADIFVLFSPDRQAGVEVLRPMGGVFEHDLDTVKDPDFLGIGGRLHQGGPAGGEGSAGD